MNGALKGRPLPATLREFLADLEEIEAELDEKEECPTAEHFIDAVDRLREAVEALNWADRVAGEPEHALLPRSTHLCF